MQSLVCAFGLPTYVEPLRACVKPQAGVSHRSQRWTHPNMRSANPRTPFFVAPFLQCDKNLKANAGGERLVDSLCRVRFFLFASTRARSRVFSTFLRTVSVHQQSISPTSCHDLLTPLARHVGVGRLKLHTPREAPCT